METIDFIPTPLILIKQHKAQVIESTHRQYLDDNYSQSHEFWTISWNKGLFLDSFIGRLYFGDHVL